MFCVRLPLSQMRLISAAPGAVYQAARWVKHFHAASFVHVGWTDPPQVETPAGVLSRHGFVHVPRFELNAVRQLLETYGPLLTAGEFRHLAYQEVTVPFPGMDLASVNAFEDGGHAILLNGYWDGPTPRLLYRDPAHPYRQFVVDLDVLLSRRDADAGIHFLNCSLFPKPCEHIRQPAA